MDTHERLAERFEEHRPHLRAVAYRMLGSLSEADDAVQESWLRFSRSDTSGVENLGGWLTTVVARVSLDMLRSRKSRREESLNAYMPDPIVSLESTIDPEQEAILADSIGFALLIVLETLPPAERLAFVLHDVFAMPFEEIAPIVGTLPGRGAPAREPGPPAGGWARAVPDADLARQREAVDAFLAAVRGGDFDALVAGCRAPRRPRCRASGRAGRPPRRAGGGEAGARLFGARRAWSHRAAGARERSRGARVVASRRAAVFGLGLHGCAGEDRRDRRVRHPGASRPARPAPLGLVAVHGLGMADLVILGATTHGNALGRTPAAGNRDEGELWPRRAPPVRPSLVIH